jgi:hypothetical protein
MLEQRGLVVKHATVVKKEGGSNYFTSHVSAPAGGRGAGTRGQGRWQELGRHP